MDSNVDCINISNNNRRNDLMIEFTVWKDIKGYEGRYQIGLGNSEVFIKSLKRKGVKVTKILKVSSTKYACDYGYVFLYKNGNREDFCIQKLAIKIFGKDFKGYVKLPRNVKNACWKKTGKLNGLNALRCCRLNYVVSWYNMCRYTGRYHKKLGRYVLNLKEEKTNESKM